MSQPQPPPGGPKHRTECVDLVLLSDEAEDAAIQGAIVPAAPLDSPTAPAPTLLLPYERQILEEWADSPDGGSGLVLLGAGLGWQRVAAACLRAAHRNPLRAGALIILAGTATWQRDLLAAELRRHDPCFPPPVEVNADVPALERAELYRAASAPLFVTPRILVVDLLSNRITPAGIAGLLVLNAQRVTESSGEGFAARLYRDGGGRGWVRALSDAPAAFVGGGGGFGRAEKVMKALGGVRVLSLWPRFRDEVAAVLDGGQGGQQQPLEVVEWETELPRSTLLIQAAIDELLEKITAQVRHSARLPPPEPGAAASGSVDALRRQMDGVWPGLPPRTKALVRDARALADVRRALAAHDGLTFRAYLESLRLSADRDATWLHDPLADVIYGQAAQRADKDEEGAEPPKWALLVDRVLAGEEGGAVPPPQRPVLVVTRESHSAAQLEAVMARGGTAAVMAALRAAFTARHAKQQAAQAAALAAGRRPWRGQGRGAGRGGQRREKTPRKQAADAAVAAQEMELLPLPEGLHVVALDVPGAAEAALTSLDPATVIMYDLDLAFLRTLEVHHACGGRRLATVHLLAAGDEERAAFLASTEREVAAFSQLIELKQHIVIPTAVVAGGGAGASGGPTPHALPEPTDVYATNSLTRVAGGLAMSKALATPQRTTVVVDVREFNSGLPAALYAAGFRLVPLTLEVADYVLTPDCAVERKAVPDLISSLASGRLYTQAAALCRAYRLPVLLIEFDTDRPFVGLHPAAAVAPGGGSGGEAPRLPPDIDRRGVGAQLVTLLTHFPRLRLLWARSQHAAAELFGGLKAAYNDAEPDPEQAAAVRADDGAGGADGPGAVNAAALEVLKRLPGVTEAAARHIIAASSSGGPSCMADLAGLPLPALEQLLLGSARNARLLHDFLHAPCPLR